MDDLEKTLGKYNIMLKTGKMLYKLILNTWTKEKMPQIWEKRKHNMSTAPMSHVMFC